LNFQLRKYIYYTLYYIKSILFFNTVFLILKNNIIYYYNFIFYWTFTKHKKFQTKNIDRVYRLYFFLNIQQECFFSLLKNNNLRNEMSKYFWKKMFEKKYFLQNFTEKTFLKEIYQSKFIEKNCLKETFSMEINLLFYLLWIMSNISKNIHTNLDEKWV